MSQEQKRAHPKFAVPEEKQPHAPSSYRVKRARLSASTPTPSPSRLGTLSDVPNKGSRSSVASSPTDSASLQQLGRQPGSYSGSIRSTPAGSDKIRSSHRPRSTSSLSHASIPLSALVSPHAPSVSRSLNAYHMRDPRKPPKIQSTPWGLRFRTEDDNGSPIHAWFFFVGFVIFPIWWVASVWSVPKTRQVGLEEEPEKAVTLDDPQVEHDAKSWRFRCRIMLVVSIFTYIPFIVLVAIFVPR